MGGDKKVSHYGVGSSEGGIITVDAIIKKINEIDWKGIANRIHKHGYAIVPDFLSDNHCGSLIGLYHNTEGYRKKVVMERYRFGLGEYKYFDYPLPDIVQTIRENLYPPLVPIAKQWMQMLSIDKSFPESLEKLQKECHSNNQLKSTPLLLKYGVGGFNTLHQDLYGDIYFPLQAVFMLNEPNVDYTGGELVLTQQIPRTQSKAIVLTPQRGDMVILTTHFKPAKGAKGYHRVNMKHGVSEVHSGERHTLGVIFHDAKS